MFTYFFQGEVNLPRTLAMKIEHFFWRKKAKIPRQLQRTDYALTSCWMTGILSVGG